MAQGKNSIQTARHCISYLISHVPVVISPGSSVAAPIVSSAASHHHQQKQRPWSISSCCWLAGTEWQQLSPVPARHRHGNNRWQPTAMTPDRSLWRQLITPSSAGHHRSPSHTGKGRNWLDFRCQSSLLAESYKRQQTLLWKSIEKRYNLLRGLNGGIPRIKRRGWSIELDISEIKEKGKTEILCRDHRSNLLPSPFSSQSRLIDQ